MRIAISTSVIQRGRTGVGQYVLALVRALLDQASDHQLVLFVLEQDLPLFDFAAGRAEIIRVPGTAYTAPYGIEGLGLFAAGLWRGCSGPGSAGSSEGSVPI